jgi:outer membrane protein assembly factor BamB
MLLKSFQQHFKSLLGRREMEKSTFLPSTHSGQFHPNEGIGGFCPAAYDPSAMMPTQLNWTRQSRYVGPKCIKLNWKCQIEGNITCSPVLGADGTIHFAVKETVTGKPNKFMAMTPNGVKKWEFVAGGAIYSSPIIGKDQTVYFGATNGKFYALYPDGRFKWEFLTGKFEILHSAALDEEGTLYLGAGKKLYALTPYGNKKWEFTVGDWQRVRTTPIIGQDHTIYFGTRIEEDDSAHQMRLYAINENGQKKWEKYLDLEEGKGSLSAPAISSDGVLYIEADSKLYAITPDQSIKWGKRWASHTPSISSEGILYAGIDGWLNGISLDGTRIWKLKLGELIPYAPLISADGTIYCVSGRKLFVVRANGRVLDQITVDKEITTAPCMSADGTIYFGAVDQLYAIGSE